MKRRFSEEQILSILQEGDKAPTIEGFCRKNNISKTTFYTWKKQYRGMSVVEIKKLKVLEKENKQLKKIVADLTLAKEAMKDALSKKW